jgi:hypothetical protein
MEFSIQMGVSYPHSRIAETFKIYCMGGIFKKCFGLHDSTGMVHGMNCPATDMNVINNNMFQNLRFTNVCI